MLKYSQQSAVKPGVCPSGLLFRRICGFQFRLILLPVVCLWIIRHIKVLITAIGDCTVMCVTVWFIVVKTQHICVDIVRLEFDSLEKKIYQVCSLCERILGKCWWHEGKMNMSVCVCVHEGCWERKHLLVLQRNQRWRLSGWRKSSKICSEGKNNKEKVWFNVTLFYFGSLPTFIYIHETTANTKVEYVNFIFTV